MAKATSKATSKATPKGWWVNPTDDIKAMILERCEESMRTPAQEILWMLRDWNRARAAELADKPHSMVEPGEATP